MTENRADFFPQPQDPERKPRNIDFSNPETANWAEIAEAIKEDPQLRSDWDKAGKAAVERNKDKPAWLRSFSLLAATLSLTATLWALQECSSKDGRVPEPDQRSPEASIPSPEEEQRRAVKAMEEQKTQEEAAAWHKEETAAEAEKEKKDLEESFKGPETPQTVKDQDTEGLDTTNIE